MVVLVWAIFKRRRRSASQKPVEEESDGPDYRANVIARSASISSTKEGGVPSVSELAELSLDSCHMTPSTSCHILPSPSCHGNQTSCQLHASPSFEFLPQRKETTVSVIGRNDPQISMLGQCRLKLE